MEISSNIAFIGLLLIRLKVVYMHNNNFKNVYLTLAIIGAVVPYYFFLRHFAATGYALLDFLAAVFATPAASGFAADLLITSFVFWIYMFKQDDESPQPWPFILLNLSIGLSCALPAYLFWCEHKAGMRARET